MSTAVELRPVALELHRLLRDIDPSRWQAGIEAAARRRLAELRAAVERLTARAREGDAPEGQWLQELARLLGERMPESALPPQVRRAEWARYRKELQQAYEGLRASLGDSAVELPVLRPTNYTRSIFHALVAIVLVVLVEEVLRGHSLWLVPLAFASTFWILELLRHKSARARAFLLWLFRAIAHPHERHRINSSTWFATALTVLGAVFEPVLCSVAIVVMGLGDPAAAFVGRRWGRTKLRGQRSLEGSLAFVAVGALAVLGLLSIWHTAMPLPTQLAIAFGAAFAGAGAELASRRLDDNFTVPLAAAAGGWLALLSVAA